jgi:hypothetical protein
MVHIAGKYSPTTLAFQAVAQMQGDSRHVFDTMGFQNNGQAGCFLWNSGET